MTHMLSVMQSAEQKHILQPVYILKASFANFIGAATNTYSTHWYPADKKTDIQFTITKD